MRRGLVNSPAGAICALTVSLLLLTGCGVIEDTVDGTVEGLTGSDQSEEAPDAPPSSPSDEASDPSDADQIVIEVRFESDGGTAQNVEVEVDSTTSPQSLREDTVDLPFSEEFLIDKTKPFPFRNVTATADAADGATYISCEIIVDGDSVASYQSSGSNARAECERGLRLGPS